MNVLLMGLRGCGKSTLGPQLAQRRDYAFVDLDQETAARLGAPSAGAALRDKGLAAFRDAEAAALADTLDGSDLTVIALGGGTPTAPGAADLIRAATANHALCIYLRAAPDTLRARIGTDPNRPPLTTLSAHDEVNALFNARDPLYRALATHTLNVDTQTPEETLSTLLHLIS